MTDIFTEVKTYRITKKCDECGNGMMKSIGNVKMTYPPSYGHECDSCKNIRYYPDQYPKIMHVDKERE